MKKKRDENASNILFWIRKKIVLLIPESSALFRHLSILGLRLNSIKKHKRLDVMKISIPVVEHCNLQCKGCTAFSPLAEEEFLNYKQYCEDMGRLAELTKHNLSSIIYGGGNPFSIPILIKS